MVTIPFQPASTDQADSLWNTERLNTLSPTPKAQFPVSLPSFRAMFANIPPAQDEQTPSGGGSVTSALLSSERTSVRFNNNNCLHRSTDPPPEVGISLVTLSDKNGNEYHIPADTKTASTEAQKKREYNAKASMRYRQKRKYDIFQRDQEIASLEDDLNNCRNLMKRYRGQRNKAISILQQNGIPDRISRSPSPLPRSSFAADSDLEASCNNHEETYKEQRNFQTRHSSYRFVG